MDTKSIYSALISAGMTTEGACGLMGNMQAESAMRSNNAQDGMTRLSDEEYTNAADNGSINFVRDAVGYGLCQWTYWSRKQALLNYAKSKGKSVGDQTVQVEFCIKELKAEYSSVWKLLCSTSDLYTAAAKVCTDYERPAVNNIDARYKFAKQFYDQFANEKVTVPQKETQKKAKTCTVEVPVLELGSKGFSVWLAQILLNKHECNVKWTDGDFGNNTLEKTKEFQRKKGLTADGIIGAKTWNALLKG